MKLQQLKGAAEVMAAKAEPSQNDKDAWAKVATGEQVERLLSARAYDRGFLGLELDALTIATQATPQQVLDLINEIESLQQQVEQKQAA